MKRQEYKVIFEPTGRQVYVLPDSILLEAAAQAGLILQTPCGGTGKCGKCRVRVVGGNCKPSSVCLQVLGQEKTAEGFRLACQARVGGDLVVEIPNESLFESQQQILIKGTGARISLRPAVAKHYIEIGAPGTKDGRADVERLRAAVKPSKIGSTSLAVLRMLPAALRANGFKGTVVTADGELIDFEPGDTRNRCYGVAIDVGTTTLVGALVNLVDGSDVAVDARINPQTSFGDDVISRIRRCREDANGLSQMRRVIIGAINDIVDGLAQEAGISCADIYEIVLAGNTTMQQIVCGIDPRALGELPFAPVFRDHLEVAAAEMGFTINRNGRAYVFPQIGGFVGGDTVAGLVVSALDEKKETMLLVDIGTNGEIVLKHRNRLMATSVAAGPAFEGARISCGMRAAAGAIEKVLIDGDLRINVIGNTRPAGICGSGLIDLAAELLRVGMIESTGRLLLPAELPADIPQALRRRCVEKDSQSSFILAHKAETVSGNDLTITQRDVRELQLATAAIRSGINILLGMEKLQPEDLDLVLLAGGFGNFIRRSHARRIGLLPPIPAERVRYIGNASLMGAKSALLSMDEKEHATRVMRKAEHIDLSLSPEFQVEFSAAMMFPEGARP